MKMSSRTRVLLIAPIVAAGIFAAGAGPASAATQSPNANCVGQAASFLNQFAPGLGGNLISFTAQEVGGLGAIASSNCFSK